MPTAPSSLVGRPEHKPYRVFNQTQNACEPDAPPGSECSERVFSNASKEGKDASSAAVAGRLARAHTEHGFHLDQGCLRGIGLARACVPTHPAPGQIARATTCLHTPRSRNQGEACQIWA
jgi:hypothetical protein